MSGKRSAAAAIQDDLSVSANDFSSLEFKVTFSNRTSRFDLTNEEGAGCQVREFLDSGIVMEVPRASCTKGHILALEITIVNSKTPLHLKALARVTQTEQIDVVQQLIRAEFVKIAAKEWSKFKDEYASRQDQVLDLLQKIRGY